MARRGGRIIPWQEQCSSQATDARRLARMKPGEREKMLGRQREIAQKERTLLL